MEEHAAEQDKLTDWCKRMGIESASDLAFFFTSYDEAFVRLDVRWPMGGSLRVAKASWERAP